NSLSRGDVPESRTTDEQLSIRREGSTTNRRVASQAPQFLSGGRVQQREPLTANSYRQHLSISIKTTWQCDPTFFGFEMATFVSRIHVPNANAAIVAVRNDRLAVRRELEAVERSVRFGKAPQFLARRRIPESYRTQGVCCGYRLAVRREDRGA